MRALLMLGVDVAGYALFLPYWPWRRLLAGGISIPDGGRIAVFRLDGIGDLILSEPALRALRLAYPKARITLFVNKWSADVAGLIDGIDEVVPLEAPFFAAFKGKPDWAAFLRDRQVVKRHGAGGSFELAIDMRGDFLSILPAWFAAAKSLVARASRGGGFLLSRVLRQEEEGTISEVELNVRLAEKITGGQAQRDKPRLKPVPESAFSGPVGDWLRSTGGDYICLAVAAPYATRVYPEEKWVNVIQLLRRKYAGAIGVLGARGDHEQCEKVVSGAGGNVFDLAGKFSLLETATVISKARLLAGNDGGLIHIASAYNVPLVQLFGPTNPACFGHAGPGEVVLQESCDLSPCSEWVCSMPESRCMDRIDPSKIAENCLRLLKLI